MKELANLLSDVEAYKGTTLQLLGRRVKFQRAEYTTEWHDGHVSGIGGHMSRDARKIPQCIRCFGPFARFIGGGATRSFLPQSRKRETTSLIDIY
eukprot:scaffold592306_cov20-Prasinocladus_malaysianus.AAC.1